MRVRQGTLLAARGAEIANAYITGIPVRVIAEYYAVSRQTIYVVLSDMRVAIKRRRKRKNCALPVSTNCPRCGIETYTYNPNRQSLCRDCVFARVNDPLRVDARRAIAQAIKAGQIKPANNARCVDCGKQAYCYDHRNYYHPLDVDPVCKSCDVRRGPGYPPIPNRRGERVAA